ncbi:MAG: TIGR00645 family protein [Hyphomonadaceae bacterium]
MSNETDAHDQRSPLLERMIEWVIYASRWLMAPVYLGLIGALGILIVTFFRELYIQAPQILTIDETEIILLVLTLVDLSLAGNLVLIILFSGYENFVSKIEAAHKDRDRPEWMGTLDFSGLKIKLIASIVAISGIHLLKIFMNLTKYTETELLWYVIIHITFIFSGVCVAAMDWLEEKAHEVASRHSKH